MLCPCVSAERLTVDERDRGTCKEAVPGFNDPLWFGSFVLVVPVLVMFNQKPTVLLPQEPYFLEMWVI